MVSMKLSRKGVLSVSYDPRLLSTEDGDILLAYAEEFISVFLADDPVLKLGQSIDLASLIGQGHTAPFKDDVIKLMLEKMSKVQHFSVVAEGVNKTLKTTITDENVIQDKLRSLLGTENFKFEKKSLGKSFSLKRITKVINFSNLGEYTPVVQGV